LLRRDKNITPALVAAAFTPYKEQIGANARSGASGAQKHVCPNIRVRVNIVRARVPAANPVLRLV